MLSFINMGGRKKRHRKRGSRGSGAGTRGHRRTSRGSGSFVSPGNVGNLVEATAVRPDTHGRRTEIGRKSSTVAVSVERQGAPQRSPEIQMEFKHASLLQSLPEEFLRYRKGSASSSSLRDLGVVKSSSQAVDWTLNSDGSPQGRRLGREKRRMAPLPSVAPIKIPSEPMKIVPTQSQQHASQIRRPPAPNSPAWASDSEISPVSGLSAARDVLASSFSFPARDKSFWESEVKERETARVLTRQDSATLPKEAVWEAARSPSVSRRSSSKSMKKRKLDAAAVDLPPFEAFILTSPLLRRDGENEPDKALEMKPAYPPRKDSMLEYRREGLVTRGPPPPGLTPSAQKLGQADQAALHRISRILETDAEGSSVSSPQPPSGSTSESFSTRSKKDAKPKSGRAVFTVPSALSTPSTYSGYTLSPYTSPGKRSMPLSAGASSAKSGYGYESFLEDFNFVGPPSGLSSRGDKSALSGSGDSHYEAQVPMTAATFSSTYGSKSASAAGPSGFRQESSRSPRSKVMRSPGTRSEKQSNEAPSPSVYSTPSPNVGGVASPSRVVLHGRNRNGSVSSTVANAGKSTVSGSNIGGSRSAFVIQPDTLGENDSKVRHESAGGNRPHPMLKVGFTGPESPEGKHQPTPPRLHVTNPNIDPSPVSASPSPLSSRSPDLLDMLIPNGHIITPISRHQTGRKRSGSAPSPIKITPSRSARYLPLNGDDDDEAGIAEVHDNSLDCGPRSYDAPSTGDIQTFPETPVLFSPDLAKDSISRSNSLQSNGKRPQDTSQSLFQTTTRFQPIVIPSAPQVNATSKVPAAPSGVNGERVVKEVDSRPSPASSGPSISPLQPPRNLPLSPIPRVQTFLHTSRPSPPLLGSVPKRRGTVHVRPPLPFGPRKPNSQPGKGTAPLFFAPRRAASESAASVAQGISQLKQQTRKPETPSVTPTFKTTPVPWRGLTLDAAKWTFSSAQLQAIVRVAIESSAQASSIRLLPQDIFEKLPASLSELEARREDIQKDYKVLVRRRRSVVQRLTSLSSSGPRTDTLSVMRTAEELASITAAGDKLAEELHEVDDQIAQVHRLQDVHQASALAVALRKLHKSFIGQTAEMQKLQMDVMNLHAERNDAWRKAEELERELDALQHQDGATRLSSVSSSHWSSRVSLARKNSSRTSKAGLRFSGSSYRRSSQTSSNSSLLVHHSTSARTTFSSDLVPPVPPIPVLDAPVITGASGLPSSNPSTSMPQSSAVSNTADSLYNVVYDLLGVKSPDRDMPSPARPRSEIYCTISSPPSVDDHNPNQHSIDAKLLPPPRLDPTTRLRSGSLPTLVPPSREVEEAGAIVAMLDFCD